MWMGWLERGRGRWWGFVDRRERGCWRGEYNVCWFGAYVVCERIRAEMAVLLA